MTDGQEALFVGALAMAMLCVVLIIIDFHRRQDGRAVQRRDQLHADIDRELRTPR